MLTLRLRAGLLSVAVFLLFVTLSNAQVIPKNAQLTTTGATSADAGQTSPSEHLYLGFIKDPAAVLISTFALFIAILGYFQKYTETHIAQRKQLSETLSALTQVNIELEKSKSATGAGRTASPIVGILNDQRRYLVRQAAFLMNRLPNDVSTPEYLVLGWAFNAIDDAFAANQAFLRSVEIAPDNINKCIAMRSYARFLFNDGDADGGRGLYRGAVNAVLATSDRELHYCGETYERWAMQEAEWGDRAQAAELIEKAFKRYRKISHPALQDRDIDRLTDLQGSLGLTSSHQNGGT